MSDLFRGVRRRIVRWVEHGSPRLAAIVDWLDPNLHTTWGGPMNGQARRREIVRKLAAVLEPEAVIETGTYRGDTTAFLADVSGAPVYSAEASLRYHLFASWELRRSDVHLYLDDSRRFLRRLAGELGGRTLLVYLDAHWEEDLPLREEIEIIAEHWPDALIIIDDFQVPDDPGYEFDDYGPGAQLSEQLLPACVATWSRLYPQATSDTETGFRRGCVVLVPPVHDPDEFAKLCGLRKLAA